MKFVIWVPYLREDSGGCNVLLNLAKKLDEYGEDAKILVQYGGGPSTIYTNYAKPEDIDDDTIVVYPEGIANILGAKRYVRWVLYGATLYTGTPEIIYYLAPFCKNNRPNKLLTSWYLPPGIENKGLPRIHQSCYLIRKGMKNLKLKQIFSRPDVISKLEGIPLDNVTSHSEMIQIFNTTKYFYCYDPVCFAVIMALLCGCVVIQHPVEGYTEDEWKRATGLGNLPGIAYGYENLKVAEDTISEASAACMELINKSDDHVKNFIRDIKTGSYSYETMYPFNSSPYSFQHKEK